MRMAGQRKETEGEEERETQFQVVTQAQYRSGERREEVEKGVEEID